MEKTHLNIVIPQWQGGGQDLSTYQGGLEIKNNYLQGLNYAEIAISTEKIGKIKNNIVGYEAIYKQLAEAKTQIINHNPSTIFTIGGGCDSDIVSIAELNKMVNGDMTVLYLDAHADLNTPESSNSKYFYGMPLRTLLGDGDEKFINLLSSQLSPSQIIMMGIRDLDQAEVQYIRENSISVLSVEDIENGIEDVIKTIRAKRYNNLYVHIDLDVLDPQEFPHVPVPVPEGLANATLSRLLDRLRVDFKIIGLGLLEYSASERLNNKMIRELVNIGCNL